MKISPLVKRTVSVLLAVSLAVGMTVPTGTTAFADDRDVYKRQVQYNGT